jgi:hypothetical protein
LELDGLRSVSTVNLDPASDIDVLAECHELRSLEISERNSAFSLSWIPSLENLETLGLTSCTTFQRLPDMSALRLRELDLSGCSELRTLEGLANCTTLRSISIDMCKWITDLEPLRGLESLETVSLRGCSRIPSLGALEELPRLRMVDARGTNLDIRRLGGDAEFHGYMGGLFNSRQARTAAVRRRLWRRRRRLG